MSEDLLVTDYRWGTAKCRNDKFEVRVQSMSYGSPKETKIRVPEGSVQASLFFSKFKEVINM